MQNDKIKNYFHLHFLVFIAGFTAILGKLITIEAVPLVWYRMFIASILMYFYIKIAKIDITITKKTFIKFALAGIIIALHWITFFGAIDASNAAIALAMFSTGAFFVSFLEPLIYKRRLIWYEILFGIVVVFGIYIILESEIRYLKGMVLGVVSAFFSALFAVLNGQFMKNHSATKISFYEFISGVLFISIGLFFYDEGYSTKFFILKKTDLVYLIILASICTAYAFIASTHVMKFISPYTVVLTYNLEPIYGIILALILFPESEQMSANFYYGATIILGVVMLNGILKNSRHFRRKKQNVF